MTSADPGCASGEEQAHRRRLGIPDDAREVVVVTESTHWDPNWMLTSRGYYRLCVRPTLDRALDALLAEPRRVFSLECIFFLEMYWNDRAERRHDMRTLVEQGRLRFTGTGVTTPDTLLPEDEMILRDLLVGREWLRSRGMDPEPRLLYLPDSFGHSPGLAGLLDAAGVPYAAVCRIDGMHFPGADWESPANFPRAGSTAALLRDARSADFVWRGPDHSEVLAHWHAFGYGHGDMIASRGLSRALGLPASWPDRREEHVARRIERRITELRSISRTPYGLLAIGFDFVRPIPRLVALLDRWNDLRYERSGIWLVNAGLDDYLDLVACHAERLPVVACDPNPYWSGFYASRPGLKRACRDLGRRLVDADCGDALGSDGRPPLVTEEIRWTAATSNHHDFITGTSPDRVARRDQERPVRIAIAALAPDGDARRGTPTATDASRASKRTGPGHPTTRAALRWSRRGPLVSVHAPTMSVTFDESRGGTVVAIEGDTACDLGALDLTSHVDSGGLWRMGNEFRGGRWSVADRSALHRASIGIRRTAHELRLRIAAVLEARPATVDVTFTHDEATMFVRSSVRAHRHRTVTLSLGGLRGDHTLVMHQPGGVVLRGPQRWYRPTFWPLHSFATAVTSPGARSLTVATAVPTAMSAPHGLPVEIVVARTASKERAFDVVPVMAPVWGCEHGVQVADLAVRTASTADTATTVADGRDLQRRLDAMLGRPSPPTWLTTDDRRVEVTAIKAAEDGRGVIARLRSWAPSTGIVPIRIYAAPEAGTILGALLADSYERDIRRLHVVGGSVHLEMRRHLSTVRLEIAPPTVRLTVDT